MTKSVPVGVRDVNGAWTFLMMLFMRPEAGIPSYPTSLTPEQLAAFAGAVQGLTLEHPFLRGKDLELTAFRQAYALDDLTSAIISFQTAMESTLFELWHLTMVDSGMTRSEIDAEIQSDMPFKTLLTSKLPSVLGGRWDIQAENTPVGAYWRDLYSLRNRVVHSGMIVQEWQLNNARSAYDALINYVAGRLLPKWRTYPRTVTAFANGRGVPPGVSVSSAAKRRMAEILSEGRPFGRPQDSGEPAAAE
jgi:hypothetical protein